MKSLHALLFLVAMSLGLASCDNGNAKVSTDIPASKAAPKAEVPTSPETKTLEEKQAAQSNLEAARGAMVEKTVQTKAAVVDDAGVDYTKIAQAICQCGAKHIGKDTQDGDVMVTKGDQKYKGVVDCSMKKKEQITDKSLNRQTLVKAIKKECNSIPPTLVMSFILALEQD